MEDINHLGDEGYEIDDIEVANQAVAAFSNEDGSPKCGTAQGYACAREAAKIVRESQTLDTDDWLYRQLAAWPVRVDKDKTTNIEYLMHEAARRIAGLTADARRWQAFSAGRFKFTGSAGFIHTKYPEVSITPGAENHLHMGLEIWPHDPNYDEATDSQGQHGRNVLMTYVDQQVKVMFNGK